MAGSHVINLTPVASPLDTQHLRDWTGLICLWEVVMLIWGVALRSASAFAASSIQAGLMHVVYRW